MELKFTNSDKVFIIDDVDWPLIAQWANRFYLDSHGYAASSHALRPMLVHRKLLGLVVGDCLYADHINGDTLDNRRNNLRVCSNQQNCAGKINTTKRARIRSKYKGVVWDSPGCKWRAQICKQYKIHYLGLFNTQELAAIAYNKAAVELFGAYARPNVLP